MWGENPLCSFVTAVQISLTNLSFPAWAADPIAPNDMYKMNMNPSKEDREKMATAHSQMVTCLRSDQNYTQCHEAQRLLKKFLQSWSNPMEQFFLKTMSKEQLESSPQRMDHLFEWLRMECGQAHHCHLSLSRGHAFKLIFIRSQ